MLFPGHSYFNLDGKGNINTYLDVILHDLKEILGKGYIGHITGNHDIPRLAYRRTSEEIKCALTFILTMPGVPFVYYGDEIGMDYIEGLKSKEGSYTRTGSRTPMQWNDEKNHGFSTSDTPYLPTDEREGAPTVENSTLLPFVKELIRYHRETEALHAEGSFEPLLAGYPFVFKRGDRVTVAINPSARTFEIDPPKGRVVFSQNIELSDGKLKMKGASFAIIEE
jgi:maltose alpha-D-glucosyltransferase/alpha-amylase